MSVWYTSKLAAYCFLFLITKRIERIYWDGRGLHGIVSQKIEVFKNQRLTHLTEWEGDLS
jgi:hypothetical protein